MTGTGLPGYPVCYWGTPIRVFQYAINNMAMYGNGLIGILSIYVIVTHDFSLKKNLLLFLSP